MKRLKYIKKAFFKLSIHHQLTNEEEKHEVSSIREYPCLATVGYVGGKDKCRLELSVENKKISFDLFKALKHSEIGDAYFEEEDVKQEIALLASTMVLQSPLEREPGYGIDCLVCDEELDDPKDSCVDHVVFEELKKNETNRKAQSRIKDPSGTFKVCILGR